MTIERIVVCDDNPKLAESWEAAIRASFSDAVEVERMEDAGVEFRRLLSRIPKVANEDPVDSSTDESEGSFDRASVLVVDYDLLEIDGRQARHTGEGFARMARLYSDCSFIIVLNQYADRAMFDLEMSGHLGSFADLNVDSALVGTPTLWGHERNANTFAPWHWPDIGKTIERRVTITNRIEANFDAPLLTTLQFPPKHVEALSDHAIGFLSASAATSEQLEAMTVREFLSQSSEHKELERAIASNGRRAAAATAARLEKWYARAVLGPQDVLVDVPHLLQRMPFLLRPDFGDASVTETWNASIAAGVDALRPEILDTLFNDGLNWLGLHTFWWRDVLKSDVVSQLRSNYDPGKTANVVFAEDCSSFIPYEDATPFRAGFHNQFDVRYIRSFPEVSYGPGRRLASV